MNWLPGEKDSLVGAYSGVVEQNPGMDGYPTRLNVIYIASGEGITNKQQEILIIGANDLKQGFGEKYQDKDGTWKLKNTNTLTYGNELPKADCNSVPNRIKADYSKVTR